MRAFQSKPFTRFARKCQISDADLGQSVRDANRGLIDADLGGGVIKQRIARTASGKSGGFRTLVVFRALDRAIFVHGFAKSSLTLWRSAARSMGLILVSVAAPDHGFLEKPP